MNIEKWAGLLHDAKSALANGSEQTLGETLGLEKTCLLPFGLFTLRKGGPQRKGLQLSEFGL